MLDEKHSAYFCTNTTAMQTVFRKAASNTPIKAAGKKPKKGSVEAILKATRELQKKKVDLSYIKQ
ncbi:MAG TPA: hypothetical protein PKJ70_03855 [Chitinophagaceae bacterium]|nr:hypothetical protein [Chitinophagaceae bacterium]MCC6634580.1 hypothetical protein [Chitinophagaceae bacterium]HNJ58672.1 hypothetical protein [Chitinophagaceae bacterium]HNM33696.1 hypothetical protein [Chitinophagaceae bacterium]HNN31007.1 hypothetical protein [Chitinophagaceae bacterium]